MHNSFWKYFIIRRREEIDEPDEEDYEDEDDYEDENAVGTSIDFSALIRFLVLVLIIGGGAFLLHYMTQRNFNGYEVVEKTNVKNSTMLDYIAYQNSLLK